MGEGIPPLGVPAPGGCLVLGGDALSGGCVVPVGCLVLEGACSGGACSWGGIQACTEADPPVNRMTDRQVKNITFTTSLRTVTMYLGDDDMNLSILIIMLTKHYYPLRIYFVNSPR